MVIVGPNLFTISRRFFTHLSSHNGGAALWYLFNYALWAWRQRNDFDNVEFSDLFWDHLYCLRMFMLLKPLSFEEGKKTNRKPTQTGLWQMPNFELVWCRMTPKANVTLLDSKSSSSFKRYHYVCQEGKKCFLLKAKYESHKAQINFQNIARKEAYVVGSRRQPVMSRWFMWLRSDWHFLFLLVNLTLFMDALAEFWKAVFSHRFLRVCLPRIFIILQFFTWRLFCCRADPNAEYTNLILPRCSLRQADTEKSSPPYERSKVIPYLKMKMILKI